MIFLAVQHALGVDPERCFPQPTHGDSPPLLPFQTVAQTIDHLVDVPDTVATHHVRMKHSDAFRARIHATPPGKSAPVQRALSAPLARPPEHYEEAQQRRDRAAPHGGPRHHLRGALPCSHEP